MFRIIPEISRYDVHDDELVLKFAFFGISNVQIRRLSAFTYVDFEQL